MGPSADTLARSLSPPPQRDHYGMIYTTALKLSGRALAFRAARYYLLPHYAVYTPAFSTLFPVSSSPFTATHARVQFRQAEENSCALLIVKKARTKGDICTRMFGRSLVIHRPGRSWSSCLRARAR